MAIKPIELIIKARDEASGVLGTLQGKLAAVGAAIATYFGVSAFIGAVRGAADFESGMSRVLAATGASTAEMKLLRQAAEDAGTNSKYSSTQAAGALETLAKAGLGAKDAIAALPAVLNLAQAGDIELGRASEFLTKAVMGMGLAFTDAGRVADVLALGANATNTSVTGLAEALSYAAPVAHSMGLSLESTVAIIGKFADAGIDASRAGTALNSILSQFSDPASKFRQELGAAGIITNNFEEALHQLAAAGPAGSKAILAVGQEAGPALRALLGQGMGALDDLTAKLKNAEGSAAATAKVMQDNLNGSLSGLSSAWDTVKNTLATPVLPVLKDAVDELAGAFKSAVSDGTIQKFGEAIAVSFQSGIKWARDFLAQIDFKQVTADLRAFADRSSEVFTQIGEYASTAGNSARLAYGVMSAGANTVMGGIYILGEAFSGVASNIQSGLALLLDGLSKITFGAISASFKQAAEEVRISAGATWAASEAFAQKAQQSFDAAAGGAQIARDGFAGLTGAMTAAKPAADASALAIAGVAQQLQAVAEKNAVARKATEDKKAADEAATVAMRQLKAEYEAAVNTGNWQLAAEKIKELKKATDEAAVGVADLGKKSEENAKKTREAFAGLGITSQASLKLAAESARNYYEQIKNDASSTAVDAANAFKAYAEKAIAANDGVATEALKVKAAMHGLSIQVDGTGKAIVSAMGSGSQAMSDFGGHTRLTTEDLKAQAAVIDAINAKYGQSKKDLVGKYDAPKGDSVVPTSGGDREKFLAGQSAQDLSLQFSMLQKIQTNTLTAADLADATAVVASLKVNNQTNQALDKFGGAFSAAGALDRAKWETVQAQLQNFIDSQKNIAASTASASGRPAATAVDVNEIQRQAAGARPGETAQQANQRQAGPTTTVNINLNGTTQSINTDAAGAATLQNILSQLGSAQSTYQ